MVSINDWKHGRIGDEILALEAGVSVNSDTNTNGANYYILKTSAVSQGKVDLREIKPVISKDISRLRCSIRANSILISRMNTPDLVGECGYVETDNNNIFLPDRIWQTVLKQGSSLNCKWLNYVLNTDRLRQFIKNAATGTSNSMKNISKDQILGIELYFPEPKEQTIIAEALSDTDSLIASLEKLIAKKKAIKQGAMQELLTGKKRLPGFSGQWVDAAIGNYGTFISGNAFPLMHQGEHQGTYPFYKVSDFNNNGNESKMDNANNYISKEIADLLQCNIIKPESIVFAKIGAAIFLERKKPALHHCCIDNNMMAFEPYHDKCDSQFIWYVFQTIRFGDLVTATALPSLSGKQIGAVIRWLPIDIAEQTAIASILSDMDAEIEQLEKKLAKYRLIKQGMMQELLTGRIRLIETETIAQPVAKAIKKTSQRHSNGYEDAVILVALVNAFGTEDYPFTAFDSQKFPYLFHRHLEGKTKGYKEFAAGPYNQELKYKTARPIAIRKKYIREHIGKYKGFVTDVNINEALTYFANWYGDEPLTWLQQFRYIPKRKDELELLTTVDMAMVELRKRNTPITMTAVKEYIRQSKEWENKLKREIFSDENISRAIKWSIDLFGEEVFS